MLVRPDVAREEVAGVGRRRVGKTVFVVWEQVPVALAEPPRAVERAQRERPLIVGAVDLRRVDEGRDSVGLFTNPVHDRVCGSQQRDDRGALTGRIEPRIADRNDHEERLGRVRLGREIDVVVEELPPLPEHVGDAGGVREIPLLLTDGVADRASVRALLAGRSRSPIGVGARQPAHVRDPGRSENTVGVVARAVDGPRLAETGGGQPLIESAGVRHRDERDQRAQDQHLDSGRSPVPSGGVRMHEFVHDCSSVAIR